jgi:signal transduction histidine kinase
VASHAGTGEAWITVSPFSVGHEAGERDGLAVTVRDAGAGFDPARVDPARLGLRQSIGERIAESGGQVSIQSAPGAGTVVQLRWPATGPDRMAGRVGRADHADGAGRADRSW